MDKKEAMSAKMTRREFLAGAGGFAAGAAVGAVLGGGALSLVSPAQAAEAVPNGPWPYVKLDPEVVRKKGYESYWQGGCMYGAGKAIIEALREKAGSPYNLFPADMLRYGAGGVAGWGTLCGALNGACAAINLVTPNADVAKLTGELLGWYTNQPFPGKAHDAYAKFKDQKQSVARSPLCHASVSNWCAASGFKEGSTERKDRCAKLTGDVAAKAVELLNAYFDGKFVEQFKPSEGTAACMGCHVGPKSALENTLTKMDCTPCHGDPHKK
ncbi:MAG: C-GCAxxG-C-C family protein [Bacillota bacterium]|nr:C-GCAxxG-C-C family protein [Bacillota bacterium]